MSALVPLLPQRHPRGRRRRPAPYTPARRHPSDAARLQPLLEAAGTLDLHDRAGWAALRDTAHTTIGALIAGGRLPAHLAVAPEDSPMVVTRTLLAAWQRIGIAR